MRKNKSSSKLLEQIQELEGKKEQLLSKRKEELWSLFKKRSAITIDDELLEGFLVFAMDHANKEAKVLHDMRELVVRNKSSKPLLAPNSSSKN